MTPLPQTGAAEMSDTQLKPTEQELKELIDLADADAAGGDSPLDIIVLSSSQFQLIKQLAQAELDRRATEGNGDVEAVAMKLLTQVADGFTGLHKQWDDGVAALGVPSALVEQWAREHEMLSGVVDGQAACYFIANKAFALGQSSLLSKQVPDAKPLSEYHEDMGFVVWWKFPVNEPAWIGTPIDSDWPGYHTHFTPHPIEPAQPSQPQSAPTQAEACKCGLNKRPRVMPICSEPVCRGDSPTDPSDFDLCSRCGHDRWCHGERGNA